MQHISLFKYSKNELGYIQCVIAGKFKEEFEALGFVDHIDKVKKPTRRKKAVQDGD